MSDSLIANTDHTRISTKKWRKQLVTFLLQVTHSQWLMVDLHVHHEKLEGIKIEQHEDIFHKVDELCTINPAKLLTKHHVSWTLILESFAKGLLLIGSIGLHQWNLRYPQRTTSAPAGRCQKIWELFCPWQIPDKRRFASCALPAKFIVNDAGDN